MRQRDDERVMHQVATQQPAGATRGRECGAERNERTERRCDNKLARRVDERVAQQEDGERQCDNQLARQDDKRV
jgi:hypothetical protein